MAAPRGTFELLGRHLAAALRPLSDAVKDAEGFKALMFRLGWTPTAMPPTYASLGVAVDGATLKVDGLPDGAEIADVLAMVQAVKGAFDAIQSISVAPPGVNAAAFLPEIRQRLFELLLTDHLAAALPATYNLLSSLNVIDLQPVDAIPGRPSFMRTNFKWPDIPKILSEPQELPKRVFGWRAPDFDVQKLVDQLGELFVALRFPVRFSEASPELVRGYAALPPGPTPRVAKSLVVPFYYISAGGRELEAAFALREAPPVAGKLRGIVLEPQIPSEFPATMRLADDITLRLRAGTNSSGLFGIVIRPDEVTIRQPLASGTPLPAEIAVGFDFTPKQPTLLVGTPGGTRLEFQGASIDLTARTGAAGAGADVALTAGLNGLALVIAGKGESLFDGFLEQIIGGGESRVGIPLGIEWGGAHGIRFQGSAAFEVQVQPHLTLGAITVETVDVRLKIPLGPPGSGPPLPDVRLELAAGITGSLGPLDFFVQGIGLRLDATFKPGNLGPLGVELGFLPPNGLGLSLDAGGFKGGGFLLLDTEKGEYAGGLELDFIGIVTVTAVGLLTTKFPDGRRGFALVIIISAEFTPIQLGFGFTLIGVGGLIGINRTVDSDALKEGVHQGALDSVLFPRDVVRNAPRIVNDLRRLFPPAVDHFLIGPMVKFGWGTPTIVSLEFGLILDLPRPAFFVIGRLRIGLPFQDAPLFDIRVAFAGGVDFEAGQLWFDGTLHDSRVLAFPLTGDMAIRLYWKQDANFVLTIGGFHPAYTPPPMALGQLQRLGITIFSGNPRLRAETYVAITSNTVQFGAKAELYFGVDIFNVYGFIALDVLIQFDPFRFVATLTAMLAVRTGDDTLMGIRIEALLEGPSPWHAKGTGHFEISLIIDIEIDVGFEVTIGDDRKDSIPAVPALPKLAEAFAHTDNWRAVLPAGGHLHVSLRKFEPPANAIVLHPAGSLEITQKLLPLRLPIQKIGSQRISDGQVFAVEHVLLGATPGQLEPLREQFAPAQFVDMSDALKLSSRSFEKYEAGVRVGGGSEARADHVKTLEVAYEVIYIPNRPVRPKFRLFDTLFNLLARGGAVGRSALSAEQNAPSPIGAGKVIAASERFAVASRADLSVHDASMVFSTEAEARAAMHAAVGRDPALTRALQVVPHSLTKAS
jgi:hypothetical protein